ncbi:DUF3017 domain-containing protein [Streptomyces qinzhouensis]|uniref:DUF3017 domain-containing protein n=1 Tax=Streptomyces qinzhouensis TaxID=2599401 RepID=A0A5B8IJG2_9ACTN|nr:DUF3017 domain-containing protein [Streptomyces qinzhouensis]QDY78622.1 DUF3017 domain-containing protein [Streptomyces qinzhouensis]
MAVRTNDDRETGAGTGDGERPPAAGAADGTAGAAGAGDGSGSGTSSAASGSGTDTAPGSGADRGAAAGAGSAEDAAGTASDAPEPEPEPESESESGTEPEAGTGTDSGGGDSTGSGTGSTRRPPALTTDTARPEGGGRAAPGDAPAPARQWPLLTVLGLVGFGLVIVGIDPFAEAARVGTLLIGLSLIAAAVMRRMIPSVGMLAVRSRFTDMITYGVLGTVISLLALMMQPNPWLEVPFLEDVVHFLVGRETG